MAEEQPQLRDAELTGDCHLMRDGLVCLLDPRGAMKKIAPSARHDPHAQIVRVKRVGDRSHRRAELEDVVQVQVDVTQAEPREHLQRGQQRLRLVRGRRGENAGSRHQTAGNSCAF